MNNNTLILWEEENSTELKMKSENNGIIVPNDITKEIENEFLKKECEDIGKKKIKERKKIYYQTHKMEYKDKNKLYREKHKEELKKYKNKYLSKNRNKISEYCKKYYYDNKEKYKEYRLQYKEKNRVIINEKARKHPFRKLSWSANSRCNCKEKIIPFDLWKIAKKQKMKCTLTGDKLTIGNISLDHIIPKSKNGTNVLSNLRLVLRSVNIARQNMTDEDFINMCKKVVNYSKK